MRLYPEFTLLAAHQRQDRFVAEAQQRRLLTAARSARGERAARPDPRGRPLGTSLERPGENRVAGHGTAAGTLAACGPRATAPAR